MILLCFFIFVLSNSATCEILNNESLEVLTYDSPGNPKTGTVVVNIDGSFNNIYIWGPGGNNNGNPCTGSGNPCTGSGNPGTGSGNNGTGSGNPGGEENSTPPPRKVYDSCEDAIRETGTSGVYIIQIPNSNLEPFEVYCMKDSSDGPAWTVIQRRKDGKVNFNQNWATYESGFGDPYADYFLGLKVIHELTRLKKYHLWIELEDWDNQLRFASYDTFSIDNASNRYKIKLGKYNGDAGDAMEDNNLQKFSTYDNDNDDDSCRNCAAEHKSGWWLKKCYESNLNGPYFIDKEGKGILWHTWHDMDYSLKHALMAIQPKETP